MLSVILFLSLLSILCANKRRDIEPWLQWRSWWNIRIWGCHYATKGFSRYTCMQMRVRVQTHKRTANTGFTSCVKRAHGLMQLTAPNCIQFCHIVPLENVLISASNAKNIQITITKLLIIDLTLWSHVWPFCSEGHSWMGREAAWETEGPRFELRLRVKVSLSNTLNRLNPNISIVGKALAENSRSTSS